MKTRYRALAASLAIVIGSAESLAAEHTSPLTVVRERGTTQIFAARGKSKDEIHAYINARHRVLDELSESSPDEVIESQISFREYLDADTFKARMKSMPVRVVSLSFGWHEQVAGYDLRNEESLDDALRSASAHHRAFVDELYTSAREELEAKAKAESGTEELERHAGFSAHSVEVKTIFDRRGLLVFGVKVRAKARVIKEMKERDPLIRLADPLWESQTPTGRVRKIGIPISPYYYEKQ
jgi:hypothetical protein